MKPISNYSLLISLATGFLVAFVINAMGQPVVASMLTMIVCLVFLVRSFRQQQQREKNAAQKDGESGTIKRDKPTTEALARMFHANEKAVASSLSNALVFSVAGLLDLVFVWTAVSDDFVRIAASAAAVILTGYAYFSFRTYRKRDAALQEKKKWFNTTN